MTLGANGHRPTDWAGEASEDLQPLWFSADQALGLWGRQFFQLCDRHRSGRPLHVSPAEVSCASVVRHVPTDTVLGKGVYVCL